MNRETMTLEQIRVSGLEVLARELGVVGMVRFLQQFETGHGDYTAQRQELLKNVDIKSLTTELRREKIDS